MSKKIKKIVDFIIPSTKNKKQREDLCEDELNKLLKMRTTSIENLYKYLSEIHIKEAKHDTH